MTTKETKFRWVTFDRTEKEPKKPLMRMTNNVKARTKRLKNASTEAHRDERNDNMLRWHDLGEEEIEWCTKGEAARLIMATWRLYESDALVRSAVNRELGIAGVDETANLANTARLVDVRDGSGGEEDDTPAVALPGAADDVVNDDDNDPFTPPNPLDEIEAEKERLDALPQTMRDAVVEARLGQGQFRKELLKKWDSKCAVTGVTLLPVLVASHIKPWKVASNEERLNPANGLLLMGTLDRLFDRGLITFEDDGAIRINPQVPESDYRALGLTTSLKLRLISTESFPFLAFHRAHCFTARWARKHAHPSQVINK